MARELFAASPYPRIAQIHAILRQGKPVTSVSLAAELEVSQRTIKRDLALMADGMGLPIEWDHGEHSWVYTRECDTLPLLRMDPREALVMALFGRLSRGWVGPALGRVLEAMLSKVAPIFGGAVSVSVDAVAGALSPSQALEHHELDHFFTLLEATLDRRVLQLDHIKPPGRQPKRRQVHPLHLADLDGRWMLVAYDVGRKTLRSFRLDRIRAVHTTDATFTPPADFDAATYLKSSLGRFADPGGKEFEVRFVLDAHAAFYAREEPWHASQQLSERPDGGAELTLRVTHLAGAKNLALRWGEHVEVLAPAELRDEVRVSLAAALSRYSRRSAAAVG